MRKLISIQFFLYFILVILIGIGLGQESQFINYQDLKPNSNAVSAISGGLIGSNFKISNTGPSAIKAQPAIAYNSKNNQYLVVWADETNDNVWGRILDGTNPATSTSAAFRIDTGGKALYPAVIYNPDANNYFVVWESYGSGGVQYITGRAFDASGKALDSSELTYWPGWRARLAYAPSEKKFLVVSVYFSTVRGFWVNSAYRASASAPFNIGSSKINIHHPDVAYGSDDYFLVVWDAKWDFEGSEYTGILANWVHAKQNLGVNQYQITWYDGQWWGAYHPVVAYNSKTKEYLVVWEDTRDWGTSLPYKYAIYGQFVDQASTKKYHQNNFLISQMNTSFNKERPVIAFDPDNELFLVTWDQGDIYGQWVTPVGPLQNPFSISSAVNPQNHSQVTFNTSRKEFLCVWEDARQSPVQIFGQRIAPETYSAIHVLSPNGGEIWQANTQQEIKWKSIKFSDPVRILISYDGYNPQFWQILVHSTPNDGSYMWTVPQANSNNCIIRIDDAADGNPYDMSDKPFTISPSGPAVSSFRINAGGAKYVDNAGKTWAADQVYNSANKYGFVGGFTHSTSDAIANTTDDPLYQSERWAMLAYRFDLPNGNYMVRLLFAEIYFNQPNNRVMDVTIEGNPLVTHLDIFSQVGHDAALDLTFPVQVKDGRLDINFNPFRNPKISAIEVVPGTPSNAYRLNAGGSSYNDKFGNTWEADQAYNSSTNYGYVGGLTYKTIDAIANTVDDPLFQSERYWMAAYRFNLPNGKYTVRLLFAEVYFKAPSQRLMSVKIEGQLRLNNLDIYAVVGHDVAMATAFSAQVNDGRLDIDFSATANLPKISAIAVISNDVQTSSSSMPKIAQPNADMPSEEYVPIDFNLTQNYPNPFNPETQINFSLPETENVELKIYNLQGQLVRTLVNYEVPAGHHSVHWDGKDGAGRQVAGGIYLYVLRAGRFMAQKKMILLK